MSLPSVVNKATTAVHPEGSLKKLGSDAKVSITPTISVVKLRLSYLLASPRPSSRMPPLARPHTLPSLSGCQYIPEGAKISDLGRTVRFQTRQSRV